MIAQVARAATHARPASADIGRTPMDQDLLQLFDVTSSTFTYFLVDRASREAVAIDSVDTQVERDIALIRRLDLRLRYVLETHAHADHITGAGKLRELSGA